MSLYISYSSSGEKLLNYKNLFTSTGEFNSPSCEHFTGKTFGSRTGILRTVAIYATMECRVLMKKTLNQLYLNTETVHYGL